MKKLLLIFLLLAIILPNSNAQTEKEIKTIKKLGLKINARNIDVKKSFVVYCKICDIDNGDPKDNYCERFNKEIETTWMSALFENGLEVGDYYDKKEVKDTENREMQLQSKVIVRGDYLITLNSRTSITITDVKNNNRMVGNIHLNDKYLGRSPVRSLYVANHIIKELIKKVDVKKTID